MKVKAPQKLAPALVAGLAARRLSPEDPVGALQVLERSWGHAPEIEAGVVALLSSSDDADVGARLAALEAHTASKLVKKEIKRTLYRLAQRGLWSEPEAPPPPSARELLGPSEGEPEAWLSAIDPDGSRLLWMARRLGDGVVTLSAVINETAGLLEFHAGEATRKALKQAHRDLAARAHIALVEAPWAHVDALLRDAHARASDPARFPDVQRARQAIAPTARTEAAPAPVDALLDRPAVAADAAALASSAAALREPEMTGWLLPYSWLEPALDAVEAARSPLVVLGPAQQEERVREAAEHAIEALFALPERRALFAARFEETAYLLAKRGNRAGAASALAAALATRGERPVADVPLLAEIARRSLALAFETRAAKAKEEAKSSLIVTPAQAIAEERARARRR